MGLACESFQQALNHQHHAGFNAKFFLLPTVDSTALFKVKIRVLLAGSSERIEQQKVKQLLNGIRCDDLYVKFDTYPSKL